MPVYDNDPNDAAFNLPKPYVYNNYNDSRWLWGHRNGFGSGYGFGDGDNSGGGMSMAQSVAQGAYNNAMSGFGTLNNAYGSVSGAIGGYLNRLANLRAYYRAAQANQQQNAMIMGNPTAGLPTGRPLTADRINWIRGNASQVQPALGGYVGLYSRAMNNVNQMFGQEKSDVATQYNNMYGKNYQDLVSSGLSGSTVASSMKAEVASQRAQAMNRVDAEAAHTRLSADMPISMAMLNYASGVKNDYPNYNPAAAAGIAGYGYGSGY